MARKPRVLEIVNRWYPKGGVEHFIESLITESTDDCDFSIASLITEVDTSVTKNTIGPLIDSRKIEDIYRTGNIIADVMNQGNFDVVHIHASNGSAFFLAALAKKAGIPKRIIHSHNAGVDSKSRILKDAVGSTTRVLYGRCVTDRWACSTNAGQYLFKTQAFSVFLNGIETEKFEFSEESRNKIRDILEIPNDIFLLGSIGRIESQKNPLFQVRVFSELYKLRPDARFCMVGSGNLENATKALAIELGVADSIIHIPSTDNPASFYSAFDALLFPPIFEGLSFVGIESQCSGLITFASDVVPCELDITDLIHFISLNKSAAEWAKIIDAQSKPHSPTCRKRYAQIVSGKGYSRSECFRIITESYFPESKEKE